MLKRSDAGMLFYPVTYAGMLLYLLLNWVSDIPTYSALHFEHPKKCLAI